MAEEEKSDAKLAAEELGRRPVIAQWTQVLELGYADNSHTNTILEANRNLPAVQEKPVCFRCGNDAENLSKCARCGVASYCSKECQILDWKAISKGGGGHKASCAKYARLEIVLNGGNTDKNGNDDSYPQQQQQQQYAIQIRSDADKEAVRNEIFGRIRIYACSFAVHRTSQLGPGFLFLQSDRTLATLSTPTPKDGFGKPTNMRAILMHFLTLAEYDSEVCRDDFELMAARSSLQQLVKEYDETKEVVLLMRFRCGHVAIGKASLVPDHGVCKVLGQQYFADATEESVQLNLDDV